MDKEKDFSIIKKYLKRSDHAVDVDKKIFEKWQLGNISLEECKEIFLKNNDIPRKLQEEIDDEYFIGWLDSIGYRHELQDV